MTENVLKETVARLAEPVVRSLGLIIWGVEILQAGRMIVRLFVDVPPAASEPLALNAACGEHAGGARSSDPASPASTSSGSPAPAPAFPASASIDQCEEISRHLGLALEVEDSIPEAYVLEVSTPGLTRTFFSLAQMRPYLGDMVEARLHAPLAAPGVDAADAPAGRRIWRGRLTAVEDDAFVLEPAVVSPEGDARPEDLPPLRVPWQAVRRASRMHIFRRPGKPGKKSGKAAGKKAGKNVAETKNTAD